MTFENVGFPPVMECKETHFSSPAMLQDHLAQKKSHLMQVMEQSCQHGHPQSMPPMPPLPMPSGQMLPYQQRPMYTSAQIGTSHGFQFAYQHAQPMSMPPFQLRPMPSGQMLYQQGPIYTGAQPHGFQLSQPHPYYIMHQLNTPPQCPPTPSSSEHSQHLIQWQQLPQKQEHKNELGTRDDTESGTEMLAVGFFNDSKHHCLSFLSPHDLSVLGYTHLFFLPQRAHVSVTSCRGLLCFRGCDDRIVICNLKTQQLQFLPPPRPCSREWYSKFVVSCGFRYDFISEDYKVIRCCDVISERLEDGMEIYCDSTKVFELYSFRENKWRNIPAPQPEPYIHSKSGFAFINGRFHWIMTQNSVRKILAFDFAKESYSSISLPQAAQNSKNYLFKTDDDSLGVVLYRREGNCNAFDLWVLREKSWIGVVNDARVVDDKVERVVGLRNGKQLFLLRESNKQLVVYDLKKNELKELNIYSDQMMLVSYVQSDDAELADPMPIGSYDSQGDWDKYWNNMKTDMKDRDGVDDVDNLFSTYADSSSGDSDGVSNDDD